MAIELRVTWQLQENMYHISLIIILLISKLFIYHPQTKWCCMLMVVFISTVIYISTGIELKKWSTLPCVQIGELHIENLVTLPLKGKVEKKNINKHTFGYCRM